MSYLDTRPERNIVVNLFSKIKKLWTIIEQAKTIFKLKEVNFLVNNSQNF